MIKNYLKIAIRNILKQKLFSFINIFSLTIGLAATLLIFLFVSDELLFDSFNKNKDTIYRVLQVQNEVDGSVDYKGTNHAILLGPTLVEEIPGIEQSVRLFSPWNEDGYYVRSDKITIRDEILYGDFEIFNTFTFPIIDGSVNGKSPYDVVITEKAANKYFGKNNAVGETLSIRIDDVFVDFIVAAVAKDIPTNSSIRFDILVNFKYSTEVGFLKTYVNNWGFGAIKTYIKTVRNVQTSGMQTGMDSILSNHYPNYASIAEQRGYKSTADYRHLELQPLAEVHFDAKTSGLVPPSNKIYSIILSVIGIGILLIGCINFMNLSVARSSNRAKEIGLRKSIGANKSQLIQQFLGESILMSMFALALAMLLADLLLPVFNLVTGKEIEMSLLFHPSTLALMATVTILTGLISGLYPAFALSRLKIEDAFSGNQKLGGSNIFTRLLVIFQFIMSTVLIVGMLVMTSQMRYIQKKDLGFKGDQVLVIPNNSFNEKTVFSHYKQALSGVKGTLSVSSSSQTFGSPSGLGGMGFDYRGIPMRVGIISVTEDYLETLDIDLIDGRLFNPELASDYTHSVIVNEAAMRDFELKLNEPFEDFAREPADNPIVIGVIKDFNYSSLTMEVEPMLLRFTNEDQLGYVLIKISPENMSSTISVVRDEWNNVAQDIPFEYTFLDDTMAAMYESELRWSKIISISMVTAIMLSCFGLFGLVAMAIAGKRSEISIRKILGAKVNQLVGLYSWKYTQLVILSFVLSIPISYYFLEQWLQTFAYRIQIDFTIYIMGGLITIGIAFSTVIYKIIEAALDNPVNALRNE